jgi:Asp-tRNA(Asn)/Glu-tRNA(Gln) amidotransferase A subunit family amidase
MRALIKYERLIPAELLIRADRVRALLRRSSAAAFERCDVLAWPTIPGPAPRIDNPTFELPSGIVPADAGAVRQTGMGNLTGLPGISVPVGTHTNGLPLALQLQAHWGREELLLDAAEHIERATDRIHVDAVPPIATPSAA